MRVPVGGWEWKGSSSSRNFFTFSAHCQGVGMEKLSHAIVRSCRVPCTSKQCTAQGVWPMHAEIEHCSTEQVSGGGNVVKSAMPCIISC